MYKTVDKQKSTQELVQESIKGVPDLTVLDDIEQAQARQQRAIINKRELDDIFGKNDRNTVMESVEKNAGIMLIEKMI